jgi:hypothetical protein
MQILNEETLLPMKSHLHKLTHYVEKQIETVMDECALK